MKPKNQPQKPTNGLLTLVVGASRCGKTVYVRDRIKDAPNVLIWDVEGQYPVDFRVGMQSDLIRVIKDLKGGKIAYTGTLSDFQYFCDVAFFYVRRNYQLKQPCVVVAEEIADVTNPGKAPDTWGVLLRRSLKYGADIYAITQRVQESDKTVAGNASLIHCTSLVLESDEKYMAALLRIPVPVLAGLVRDQTAKKFGYLEREMSTGETTQGLLTFPNGNPRFKTEGRIDSGGSTKIH